MPPSPHTSPVPSTALSPYPPLPPSFILKKRKILSDLSTPISEYTDKSRKGSVDAPIIELIDEINGIDGLVTTSSCSGRVAVFVEGKRGDGGKDEGGDVRGEEGGDEESEGEEVARQKANGTKQQKNKKQVKSGPGGKGGGKWLYVSHEPPDLSLAMVASDDILYFTRLCGLTPPTSSPPTTTDNITTRSSVDTLSNTYPQLIHLSFSPLILHILTATLHHARPLLSAAINAGFRESGVQSLAALDDLHDNQIQTHNSNGGGSGGSGTGTMLAIRTAGLAFSTVVGRVVTRWDENVEREVEVMESVVSEEYLKMCFGVIGERFRFNEERKERLRAEIRGRFGKVNGEVKNGLDKENGWESKEERRMRKREEGLRRREEMKKEKNLGKDLQEMDDDDDHIVETSRHEGENAMLLDTGFGLIEP